MNISFAQPWPSLLLTHTLQLTLLIGVVWLCVRVFAKNRPRFAHTLWALVLLKAVTPPIIALPTSPFSWSVGPAPGQSKSASTNTNSRKVHAIATPTVRAESSPAIPLSNAKPTSQLMRADSDTSLLFTASELERATLTKKSEGPHTERSGLATYSTELQESWSQLLIYIWAAGAFFSLTLTLARLSWFGFTVHRKRKSPAPETLLLLKSTVEEMGLPPQYATPSRIQVVEHSVGPAVIGLLRPRILLPQLLEKDCTAQETRMLLAHELTHIRRGDLWWAALQILACSWWWFHPLIHFVNRLFDRVTEMSCDEETISRLNCEPKKYAASLVAVLERKHRLKAAPALPGVRPMDVTLQRMERIMSLSTKGLRRKRTGWALAFLAIAAAIVLPGAQLINAQTQNDWLPETDVQLAQSNTFAALEIQSDAQPQVGTPLKTLPKLAQAGPNVGKAPPKAEQGPQVVKTFDASEPLATLQKQKQLSKKDARAYLASTLETTTPAETKIIVDDNQVVVQGTEPALEIIEQNLDRMVEHGFTEQIELNAEFYVLNKSLFEQLGIDWQLMQRKPGELPVITGLVTATQSKRLKNNIQGSPTANLLQAPRIVAFNGQSVNFEDTVERPFVVKPATKTQQPEIQIEKDGFKVEVTPTWRRNATQLEIDYAYSKVLSVNTFTFSSDATSQSVQTPDVEELRFQAQVTIPHDRSVAFAMPHRDSPNQVHLLVIRSQLLDETAERVSASVPMESIEKLNINSVTAPQYWQAAFPEGTPADLEFAFSLDPALAVAPASSRYPKTLDSVTPRLLEATQSHETIASPPQSLWFKADGPPVAPEVKSRTEEVLSTFDIEPQMDGDWKLQDESAEGGILTIRGKNLAIRSPEVDFELVCPDGNISFNETNKTISFRAHAGELVKFRSQDPMIEIEGEELLEFGGLDSIFSGNTKFSIASTNNSFTIIGQADSIAFNYSTCQIQGNVSIEVDDMQATADEVQLNLDDNTLLLNGNVSMKRSSEANPLEVKTDYLDVNLETMSIQFGN